MDASLLVSLSGIGPRTLHRCADLAAELDHRKVPLSLLFDPRTDGAVGMGMGSTLGNHRRPETLDTA